MTDSKQLVEDLQKAAAEDDPTGWGNSLYFDAAEAITDLSALLRIETKRADDAEARNDFLIKELDKLIEKAKQS